MATACVASPLGGTREVDYYPQKTQRQWGTGPNDFAHWLAGSEAGTDTWTRRRRCASASNGHCPSRSTSRPITFASPLHRKAFALVAELLRSITRLPRPHEDHSLLKEDEPSALPPLFDSECLAQARIELAASAPAKSEAGETTQWEIELLRDSTMECSVNFADATRIQTRGKAAKKAAKKAQQSKWMDSDDEDGAKNGDGGNDGEGGGGNEGGGSGGAGGNGDGGAGGDDDGDWDFGGKKNKKNKKKAKQEEEEKKAKEEELKKQEEDIAAANTLSWADETNEANMDDEWAAFSSKKEKKKKGKKGAEETMSAAPNPPTSAFDEISLNDGAPKLDFSFGGAESKKDTKAAGFDGWGKTWDFASIGGATIGDKAAEAGKDASADFDDNNPWSIGNKNKTKKKTAMTGGFDFGGFGVGQDSTGINLESNEATEVKPAEEDTWGFSAVGKKDKKKKGKDATQQKEDISNAHLGGEKEKEVDDSWGIWDTSKKDKKKGAKGVAEDTMLQKKADSTVAEPASTFDWGLQTSKKDKKNKKTALVNEVDNDPVVAIEETATGDINTAGDDDWMNSTWTSSSKKDKKGKKGVDGDSTDPPQSTTAVDTNTTSTTMIGDDEWGLSTTKSKKNKKGKKADAKESDFPPVPPPPPPPPAPVPAQEEDSWDIFDKKDKKSARKAKTANSEPSVQGPEPSMKPVEEVKEDSTWGSWGFSSKDKNKYKDAKKKDVADPVAQALTKSADREEVVLEDDTWSPWGMAGKKKSGKKGRDEPPPPAPTPPAQGLTPEPEPAAMPEWEDDGWAELTSSKTKNNAKKGVLSRSTTLTGTLSKQDDANAKFKDSKDKKGEAIASLKDEKDSSKKDAIKDETPAKTARSMWGSFGATTSAAKAKLAKEKEKGDEEKAKEAEEAALAEFLEPVESTRQPPKSKTASKSSKSEAKSAGKSEDKKADEAAFINILDEPVPNEEKAPSKLKNLKADAKTSADKKNKGSEKEEKKPDDYFGAWGTMKKTAGKKEAETKKEINKQGLANENDALASFPNALEEPIADEPPSTSKPSKTMSTSATKSKNTVSSSVSARIKALEANKKEEKADKSKGESRFAKDLSAGDLTAATSPKEEKKKDLLPKSKTASANTPKSIRKNDLSSAAQEKKSKETVPGSFPGAIGDEDDLMALDDFPAAPEEKSVKKAKDKKTPAKSKTVQMEDVLVEAPEPPKLPTPPPEEKKPAKKERARVERTGAASSWGFWGAASTPKKEITKKEATRSVEEEAVSPPPKKKSTGPGLSRSKSTKTPKEKERDDKRDAEKASKSSGSDTKDKRPEARASKPNRGMSFSSFIKGGPPPSAARTKPTHRSSAADSRSASRRQSINIDAGGLMSPPPDEQPEISDKAAKLIGVRGAKLDRTKSGKGKERASIVPDPYPIDDDDMVMVNGLEDPLVNGASSKSAAKGKPFSKTNPKRESKSSKPRARTLSNEEDVVMVEAGPSGGEPFITSGPDDMAFVEHSAPGLKRSNTATKKPGGFFGGLFGGGSKAEKAPELTVRPRPTSSYRDDRMIDAEAQPTRTKDKSKRRSLNPHHLDVDGVDHIETNLAAEARGTRRRTAQEAGEAERAEPRKSRREKERAELEARRSKARDRARKEQEAEEQRREAKRARRAAREEARLKEEADVEAAAAARRDERRRLRAELEASELEKARVAAEGQDGLDKIRNSAKEDRKKQFEREEEERLRRREEKKIKTKDKSSGGKRKSTISPLMDDYFESRNGSAGGTPKQPGGSPDKTSSWVKSQASDPPDLPPVEGTILDGEKPRSAGFFADEERGEERRRSSKKESSKRHVKYADAEPEERDRERRARRKDSRRAAAQDREEGGIKSASGSDGERDHETDRIPKHKSRRREVNEEYDAYADGGPVATAGGIRTFDGRPANNKRNSILGRLGSFL